MSAAIRLAYPMFGCSVLFFLPDWIVASYVVTHLFSHDSCASTTAHGSVFLFVIILLVVSRSLTVSSARSSLISFAGDACPR